MEKKNTEGLRHRTLCDCSRRIQDILSKNNFEIKEGPNIGNVSCYWLVKKGQPYYKGVYITKK